MFPESCVLKLMFQRIFYRNIVRKKDNKPQTDATNFKFPYSEYMKHS